MATNFWVKIGRIGLFTSIRRPGSPKRIAIAILILKGLSCYIMCKFGEL